MRSGQSAMPDWRKTCTAVTLALCVGTAAAAEQEIVFKVGVDPDAAPFSYSVDKQSYYDRDNAVRGPLAEAGYRGYVVQVCDSAMNTIRFRHRNVRFEPVEVTTATRFGSDRAGWHILCDPASMTALRGAEHEPTLPIYLSGVGFARLADIPAGKSCQTIAGVASHTTTAHAGVLAIAEAGVIPRWTKDLRTAVSSEEKNRVDCVDAEDVPIVAFKQTHSELAEALCDGKILYYIGDMEIVRAALERIPGCDAEFSDTTYGDERYTIYTESDGLSPEAVRLLHDFRSELSRQALDTNSSLLRAYRAYLGNHRKSRKLSAFYWGVVGAF